MEDHPQDVYGQMTKGIVWIGRGITIRKSSFAIFLLTLSINLAVQNSPLVDSIGFVNYGYQYKYHSQVLNETRSLNVSLPENFQKDSKEHLYPVFLLLENEFFQIVSGVVKHL